MADEPGNLFPGDCEPEQTWALHCERESARQSRHGKLRLLYHERRVLGRAAVAGVLTGTLLAFLIPLQYRSTTRLMPPASAAVASGVWAGLIGSLGVVSGSQFIGVLGSRTVQDQIVQHFDLRRVYGVRFELDALKELAKRTDISEDLKNGIITLTVTDRDPKRAAAIARAYVDDLNSVMLGLSTSSAHRERLFLEGRLLSVKQALESAERRFSEFSSRTGAIDMVEQGRSTVEATLELQGQMNAADAQLAGMRQVYGDDNAEVRQVRARIAELGRQFEKLGGNSDAALEQGDYGSSVSPPLHTLPILGVPYADLERQVLTQSEVVELLTKQYESAKLEEARQIPTVQVLDPPQVPEKASFAARIWMTTAATIGITAISLLGILGRAHWKAIDSNHPGKLLVLEVIGSFRTPPPKITRHRASEIPWRHRSSG